VLKRDEELRQAEQNRKKWVYCLMHSVSW